MLCIEYCTTGNAATKTEQCLATYAGAVAAAILCPSAILDAEYGHACSDAEQHLNE